MKPQCRHRRPAHVTAHVTIISALVAFAACSSQNAFDGSLPGDESARALDVIKSWDDSRSDPSPIVGRNIIADRLIVELAADALPSAAVRALRSRPEVALAEPVVVDAPGEP